MKPLSPQALPLFLQRFDDFKNAEFRSLEVVSPTLLKAIFAIQDAHREFDWITLELEFHGIDDAKLIKEEASTFIDMSDGVTLLFKNNLFGFCIGKYQHFSSIKDSICYIYSSTIKYQENNFRE